MVILRCLVDNNPTLCYIVTMKYTIIALALLLAACAHNNYSVVPGGSVSQKSTKEDLTDCQHEVVDKYQRSQPPMTGGQIASAVAGGALGGAIGGAILGSAIGSDADNNHTMKPSDINPNIDNCMHGKGYSGHSY